MQDLYTEQLISYVDQLKSVRPTLWGQVKLSAYPQEVVLHADTVTLNCKKNLAAAFDRWKYLMSVCSTYCKENGIDTFWPQAISLGRELQMPNEGPFFDESHIPVKEKISISKSINKRSGYKNQEGSEPKTQSMAERQAIEDKWHENYLRASAAIRERNAKEDVDLKISNPVIWEKRQKTAQEFRKMLGLNEDGIFQEGKTPEAAVSILIGNILKPEDYEESYDQLGVINPFGDRN